MWRWWAGTLAGCADNEGVWTRPTRLEGWDVAALVAHHAFFVRALGILAASPVDAPPTTASAEAMLRRFNEPAGLATAAAAAVAAAARQQAASVPPEQLVATFRDAAPQSIEAVLAAGPIVIEYFGNGPFPLAEAVRIGVLEAVVHGFDLCATIDVDPRSLPSDAVGTVVALLAALADPVQFIEAATGRVDVAVLPVLR